MTINEKALAAALTAFIAGVRQQDPDWTDEFDEEITLVSPDGDYFAPELPLQAAITAYLSALGSEPVAWQHRRKLKWETTWGEWEFGNGIGANLIDFDRQTRPLYAAPQPVLGDDADEAYEIGLRDGYENAVQEIDVATGGDGEFKGSTFPGETVDVPAMRRRIIDRLTAPQPVPEGWKLVPVDGGQPLTAKRLADALGCFWNAAIGEARNQQEGLAFAAIMAEGVAAVQHRLSEIDEQQTRANLAAAPEAK